MFVTKNNVLGNVKEATFNSLFNRALAKGSENGTFDRPKGMFSNRSIQHVMVRKSWFQRSPLLYLVIYIPSCRCVEALHSSFILLTL
jgi:hypothetical protein